MESAVDLHFGRGGKFSISVEAQPSAASNALALGWPLEGNAKAWRTTEKGGKP